jgi:hypothetical protein
VRKPLSDASISGLQSVAQLHTLQVEITTKIESKKSFYLKIEGNEVKVVTGFRAWVSNLLGFKKFDLDKVLTVFDKQVEVAYDEIRQKGGDLAEKNVGLVTEALGKVVDCVAYKYTDWKLNNFRPKPQSDFASRASALREKYLPSKIIPVQEQAAEPLKSKSIVIAAPSPSLEVTQVAQTVFGSREGDKVDEGVLAAPSTLPPPAPARAAEKQAAIPTEVSLSQQPSAAQAKPTVMQDKFKDKETVRETSKIEPPPPIPLHVDPLATVDKPLDTLKLPEAQVLPLVKDAKVEPFVKLEPFLFEDLYAGQKKKNKQIGWDFTGENIVFRDKTSGHLIKEEILRTPEEFLEKLKTTFAPALKSFEQSAIMAINQLDFEQNPTLQVVREELNKELESLKKQDVANISPEILQDQCTKLAKLIHNAKIILESQLSGLDGSRPGPKPSKKWKTKEREAQVPLLILELKALAKLSLLPLQQEMQKIKKELESEKEPATIVALQQKQKSLQMDFDTRIKEFEKSFSSFSSLAPISSSGENFIKCLKIFHEFQKRGISFEPLKIAGAKGKKISLPASQELIKEFQTSLYLKSLEQLVHQDKPNRFTEANNRGRPAKRIFDRLQVKLEQGLASEKDFEICEVMINAFLAEPKKVDALKKFYRLELEEFQRIAIDFSENKLKTYKNKKASTLAIEKLKKVNLDSETALNEIYLAVSAPFLSVWNEAFTDDKGERVAALSVIRGALLNELEELQSLSSS